MGKASSSKKVARAARAGGRVSSGQPRSLLFPGVLALIIVLGVSLVVYARNDRNQEDIGGTPQLEDHIHQAFGVNVCGEWKTDIPEFESPVGIHTHGDGVLHVHPFSQLGVGSNATLGRFIEDASEDGGLDISLSDSKLVYLGETIEEGTTECEGVTDPVLRLAYWESVQDEASAPEVTTGDFTDRRLSENGAGITIFFGDADADIPKPPAGSNLAALGAADGPSSLEDPETAQTTTSTTVAGSTTTTAAGGTTTTTAAP
jgi:hypothetical protein